MRNLLMILLVLMFFQPVLAQTNDSTVVITIDQVKTINKAFKDLELTKEELRLADSIIVHKDNQIMLRDSIINLKNSDLKKEKKVAKKRIIESSAISLVIGFLLGLVLL